MCVVPLVNEATSRGIPADLWAISTNGDFFAAGKDTFPSKESRRLTSQSVLVKRPADQ